MKRYIECNNGSLISDTILLQILLQSEVLPSVLIIQSTTSLKPFFYCKNCSLQRLTYSYRVKSSSCILEPKLLPFTSLYISLNSGISYLICILKHWYSNCTKFIFANTSSPKYFSQGTCIIRLMPYSEHVVTRNLCKRTVLPKPNNYAARPCLVTPPPPSVD